MLGEQTCTMILPVSLCAIRPEDEVQFLNRCSVFVRYLYKDRYSCSGLLIRSLVDAHFVNLQRWRQISCAQHVIDELKEMTGFVAEGIDLVNIIKMHTVCTQELGEAKLREDFIEEPSCLWTHYPHPRKIPVQMHNVYLLLGAAADGCFHCFMHLVHGCDIPFDSCSLNYRYTPLDWARWNRRFELVAYLERLMMRQEIDPDFVMVETGGSGF